MKIKRLLLILVVMIAVLALAGYLLLPNDDRDPWNIGGQAVEPVMMVNGEPILPPSLPGEGGLHQELDEYNIQKASWDWQVNSLFERGRTVLVYSGEESSIPTDGDWVVLYPNIYKQNKNRIKGGKLIVGSADGKIQTAINLAENGDKVVVPPGTYKENLDFKGKRITLRGFGAEKTIIDGGGKDSVIKVGAEEQEKLGGTPPAADNVSRSVSPDGLIEYLSPQVAYAQNVPEGYDLSPEVYRGLGKAYWNDIKKMKNMDPGVIKALEAQVKEKPDEMFKALGRQFGEQLNELREMFDRESNWALQNRVKPPSDCDVSPADYANYLGWGMVLNHYGEDHPVVNFEAVFSGEHGRYMAIKKRLEECQSIREGRNEMPPQPEKVSIDDLVRAMETEERVPPEMITDLPSDLPQDGNYLDNDPEVRAMLGAATRIEGVTIQNGKAENGGGILFLVGPPVPLLIKDVVIRNNEAKKDGGGISFELRPINDLPPLPDDFDAGGDLSKVDKKNPLGLIIHNVTFEDNVAAGQGNHLRLARTIGDAGITLTPTITILNSGFPDDGINDVVVDPGFSVLGSGNIGVEMITVPDGKGGSTIVPIYPFPDNRPQPIGDIDDILNDQGGGVFAPPSEDDLQTDLPSEKEVRENKPEKGGLRPAPAGPEMDVPDLPLEGGGFIPAPAEPEMDVPDLPLE